MYVIMVDDDILYHPLLVNEGRAVTSATVDVELDKTGSATITIPVSNVMYDSISKMKSMIQVLRDGEEIFRGRVLHDERDFNGNKEIYCEGELAFMIDNVLSPRSFNNRSVKSVFTEMVNVYNTQVEQTKQFTVGEVTVEGTVNYTSWDFAILWDEINERLVNVYGGHIRTRLDSQTGIRYIDYLADYSHVCDQAIEFGVNLLDFSEYISAEDLFTVLIPLGAKQEDADGNYIGRVNITSVTPGGHEYVSNREAEDLFGNIWKINVWDDVTDPNELKALGEAYLAKNLTEATTITITAIDLSLVDVDAEAIHIGDGIRVVSLPHNIDDIFQCSRISYDILSPQNSEYEFGKPLKSISQGQVDSNTSSSAAIAQSEARTDEALTEAKLYTDLEILKTTNAYESDRTVILNENTLNSAYSELIDLVSAKQYRTSNGENRLKFGIVAEDIVSALSSMGITESPIVTSLGSGRYSVSYDEIVALLWNQVRSSDSRIFATPQQYGAVGDGVHDDTIAINTCIQQNQTVFIPAGYYCITASISLLIRMRNTVFCSDKAMFIADKTAFNSAIAAATEVSDRPSMLTLQYFSGWNAYGLYWFGGVFNCNEVEGLTGVKINQYISAFGYIDHLFVTNIGNNGIGVYVGATSSKLRFGQMSIMGSNLIYDPADSNSNWTIGYDLTKECTGWYNDKSYDYSIASLDINACLIGIYSTGGTEIQCDNYHHWLGVHEGRTIDYDLYIKSRSYVGAGDWHFDLFYPDGIYLPIESKALTVDRTHMVSTNPDWITNANGRAVESYLVKPTSAYGSFELNNINVYEVTQGVFKGVDLSNISSLDTLYRRDILRTTLMYQGSWHGMGPSILGNFAHDHRSMETAMSANTYYVIGYIPNIANKLHLVLSNSLSLLAAECDIWCNGSSFSIENARTKISNRSWTIGVGSITKNINGFNYYPVVIKTDSNVSWSIVTIESTEGLCIIAPNDIETYSGATSVSAVFL